LVANSFDIAVLGGGSAGSTFAVLTARRGARVALVEKSDFGAFRPGEHLPPAATGALAALGCNAKLFDGIAMESPGILSDWSGGQPLYKSYVGGRDGLGLNLSRAAFDGALFAHARRCGVTCFDRTRVVSTTRAGARWEISAQTPEGPLRMTAGLAVDATGRTAAFARRQGVSWQSYGDLTAVAAVLPHHGGMAADDRLLVAACETGWWSATPTSSGAVVATFYGNNSLRRRERLDAAQWWAQGLASADIVAARLGADARVPAPARHFVFPAFPRLMRPMQGPGWFAIGDAATCHDPLSGHGILYALESAFRAAEMSAGDLPLDRLGRAYEEAIVARFMRHIALRRDAYAEAAHRFRDKPFWRDATGDSASASR
jgi:2-polyprenyl-6-methoxyphenol hydroxylase-like FAD-dependent oxidoreductase